MTSCRYEIVLSLSKRSAPNRLNLQVCPDFTGVALGLENCFTAFVALAFGMAVGFVFFVVECCSRICRLNFYILEAYDRGDDGGLAGINPDDVRRVVDFKDAIIDEMTDEAASLRLRIQELEKSKGRNGSRVQRRIKNAGSFRTRDDPWR